MPVGVRDTRVAAGRRRVVDAVRHRLIADGYHGLSLEQVAADAGITRVTIYRQFGSKLGLLAAAADDLAARGEVVPRVAEALAASDPVIAFRSLVTQLCRFWSTDPELFRRLVGLAAVDPEAGRVIADRESWRHRQVGSAVRRLAAAGLVRPAYRVDQATALVTAATSFPTCDQIATATRRRHAGLPDLLLPMLDAVVRLA